LPAVVVVVVSLAAHVSAAHCRVADADICITSASSRVSMLPMREDAYRLYETNPMRINACVMSMAA
jgi:hypothetical protein